MNRCRSLNYAIHGSGAQKALPTPCTDASSRTHAKPEEHVMKEDSRLREFQASVVESVAAFSSVTTLKTMKDAKSTRIYSPWQVIIFRRLLQGRHRTAPVTCASYRQQFLSC